MDTKEFEKFAEAAVAAAQPEADPATVCVFCGLWSRLVGRNGARLRSEITKAGQQAGWVRSNLNNPAQRGPVIVPTLRYLWTMAAVARYRCRTLNQPTAGAAGRSGATGSGGRARRPNRRRGGNAR